MAVKRNSLIDYFGQPVNNAAKLQSYAEADEVVVSEAFMTNEMIQTYLIKKHLNPGHKKQHHCQA